MNDYERGIRQKLKDDFIHYANKCLKIRSKSGIVEPFILNRAQSHIHQRIEEQKRQTGKVRALVLKGRQQGCSTYVGGRFYHRTTHNFGTQSFILTHALDATNNLFKMAQRFYGNTPSLVRPVVSTNNSKELIFGELDSGYKLGTAENKSVGRSATIQLFHGSECAFWSNASEHAKGIMQAVPDARGTEVILESTANGVGNYFHQQWQKAEAGLSDFIAIFVPWFWQEEYTREADECTVNTAAEEELKAQYGLTDGQIAWRRYKIVDLSVNGIDGEKAFNQEYPCNSNEAFQLTGEDTYITSDLVMRARKTDHKSLDRFGPVLMGVDPARFGDDRTAIVFRQTRIIDREQYYIKKDTMEIVGICVQNIKDHSPDKVFIDIGGLGAGVYDRLCELGHRDICVAVNAGAKPFDSQRFINKRSELWADVKAYLQDAPCSIPDSDSLHADLCGPRFSIDSNSRLVIEKKAEMKKRGIRSPDGADAIGLTFALPQSAFEKSKISPIVNSMAKDLSKKLKARKSSIMGMKNGSF